MTSIVAWAGRDERAIASLYIASDSRISWDAIGWNQARKTFASPVTPHIFGYWGDVMFPSVAIPTILDELAADVIRPQGSAFGGIASGIRRLWVGFPEPQKRDFGIIMATRRRKGMQSVFELAILTYKASTGSWDLKEVPMPQSSARLHLAGTGAREVRSAEKLWEESAQGGTSRAIYSAFCEALGAGGDSYSGGGPQLVGLRRVGNGIRFGTIYKGKRYLAGARITQRAARLAKVEWFNSLFERAHGGRATRLLAAQKHMIREKPLSTE